MHRKIYPLFTAIIFLLVSCGQSGDTQEPVSPGPLVSIPTETLESSVSLQSQLLGLVPPDYLGAGYYDLGLVMADPDLNSALEAILFNPFQGSRLLGSSINGMLSFSMPAGGSSGAAMSIVHIFHGDFADITLAQLAQEIDLDGAVIQDYQGFEMMVGEQADSFNTVISIIDETTIMIGEQYGVNAVIDTALGVLPAPLADLDAALPQLLTASVFNYCPQYEALGCTAMIVPGLGKSSAAEVSLLHIYQFEEPGQAAGAMQFIEADAESGNITQTGSIKISGENISRDGRYVIIEELISVDDVGAVFEQ